MVALARPGELSFAPPVLVVNLVATALIVLVLLLGFPPDMFNAALERLADRRRARRDGRDRLPTHPVMLLAFAAVAAAVTTAAAPAVRLDAATLRLFAGLALAIVVTTAAVELPAVVLAPRGPHWPVDVRPHVAGIAVAALLALVGHACGLRPPYVYGLVAGLEVATWPLDRGAGGPRRDGVAALAGAVVLLGVSLAAWVAWAPLDRVVGRGGAGGVALAADAALAALVVTGLTTVTVGYLPLRFMDGLALFRWKRWVWALVWGAAVFVTLQVLADRHSRDELVGYAPHVAVWVPVTLFAGFGLASIAFRAVVHRIVDEPARGAHFPA